MALVAQERQPAAPVVPVVRPRAEGPPAEGPPAGSHTTDLAQPGNKAELFALNAGTGALAGYEMTRRFYEIGSFKGLAETKRLLFKPRLDS